ncbi:hypothetical protein ZWY2020_048253 [Hordeum vulgare]|nr:hypothetical protein ZWY2020_048253 [Hordeum vulgare]
MAVLPCRAELASLVLPLDRAVEQLLCPSCSTPRPCCPSPMAPRRCPTSPWPPARLAAPQRRHNPGRRLLQGSRAVVALASCRRRSPVVARAALCLSPSAVRHVRPPEVPPLLEPPWLRPPRSPRAAVCCCFCLMRAAGYLLLPLA